MKLNSLGLIAKNCWMELPDHFKNIHLGEFVVMPDHFHGIIIIKNKSAENFNEGCSDNIPLSKDFQNWNMEDCDCNHEADEQGNVCNASRIAADGQGNVCPRRIKACLDPTGATPVTTPVATCVATPGETSVTTPGETSIIPQSIIPVPPDIILSQQIFELKKMTPGKKRFRNQGKNTISAMVGSYKSAVSRLIHEFNDDFGWQSRFYDHVIRSDEDFIRISDYIKRNPEKWEQSKIKRKPEG